MDAAREKPQAPEPVVSVIIPCYNSERTIRECLRSITNQVTPVPFDVTVVDSSSDSTSSIVRNEFKSVRLIQLSSRTFAGAARNIGIRATAGRYCLMIDSDCVAAPALIERMVCDHRKGAYAAVGGSMWNGTPESWSGLLCYLMEFKEFIPTAPLREVTSVPTANVCYRREALEQQGGFDDSMWLAEDILLNWKIHRSGGHILFDPEIKVTHFNRTGWLRVLSYQLHMGRYSAKARKRGGLPGKIALTFPALVALMPFARLLRAALWLMKYNKETFMRFLAISPMYLIGSAIWAVGFFEEAASAFEDADPGT
ncbi:MAG TPA: glycosyltransferase [Blastocatellia bacterium]